MSGAYQVNGAHQNGLNATLNGASLPNILREGVDARVADLKLLAPRITDALCAAELKGINLLQVWPNGADAPPALGLIGRCEMDGSDKLHRLMGNFKEDIGFGKLTYHVEHFLKERVATVTPWQGYKDPVHRP